MMGKIIINRDPIGEAMREKAINKALAKFKPGDIVYLGRGEKYYRIKRAEQIGKSGRMLGVVISKKDGLKTVQYSGVYSGTFNVSDGKIYA